MNIKVYLPPPFEAVFLTKLNMLLHENIDLYDEGSLPEPPDYHIIITGRPERHHLTDSPSLHTLIIPWSGLPVKAKELLSEFPNINVYNIHHNAAPAAETAIMLMLAAARKSGPIDRTFRNNDWTPRYEAENIVLLKGRRVLILGYGAIGKKVARICRAMDMMPMAIGRQNRPEKKIKLAHIKKLSELLPEADILIITAPLTAETEGLIGADEISLLPDGAIIVNVSRGPVVDETALYEELRTGRINAGLDVWYNYPTDETSRPDTAPSKYPFDRLDNVVMSPHMGGHSDMTEQMRLEHLAELLNKAAEGRPLPNRIDISRGY